jgi:hypothetical protein
VSTSQVSVTGKNARTAHTSPLAEVFAGLVIIIASIYAIAGSFAGAPYVTAGYGAALAVIAGHMWRHGAPRSLRWLCVAFGVTAIALAIFGVVA